MIDDAPIDFAVPDFQPAAHPRGITLEGAHVRIVPMDPQAHAAPLLEAHALDHEGVNWRYLPYGPFETAEIYERVLQAEDARDGQCLFTVLRREDARPVGALGYLRITPQQGSIEVGHVQYSPLLQRTIAGTEVMFLMMKWVFEHGYRRYEWKCHAMNEKSRYAAQRLGFSYEGVFRQAAISKGRNRNTAWFGIIDSEWPALKSCFERYLAPENFDADDRPIVALSELTRPLLYKQDTGEFLNG